VTVIANLLASGCIDSAGVANALTSKLSAAQGALGSGQIQTAINTLGAFKSQVQAQAGKHISTSCTTTFTLIVSGTASSEVHLASANVSVASTNAANILLGDVTSLITRLAGVTAPDPITGFVLSGGSPVGGATVGIFNGSTPVPGFTATSDATGFYYFSNSTALTTGVTYTVEMTGIPGPFTSSTPSSQTFTWGGKGLALMNFLLN
jgi:hypothetical protein